MPDPAQFGQFVAVVAGGLVRHQAPAQRVQAALAGLRVAPDDHRGMGRRHVPIGRDIRQLARGAEQAGDELGRKLGGETAAHHRTVFGSDARCDSFLSRCGAGCDKVPLCDPGEPFQPIIAGRVNRHATRPAGLTNELPSRVQAAETSVPGLPPVGLDEPIATAGSPVGAEIDDKVLLGAMNYEGAHQPAASRKASAQVGFLECLSQRSPPLPGATENAPPADRLHSALGYQSPMAYEAAKEAATAEHT